MRRLLFISLIIIISLLTLYCPPVWSETPVYSFTNIGAAEREQIKNNMIAAGFPKHAASNLVNLLHIDGKTAYQVGSTLFIGDKESLIAGNYIVAGISHFPAQKHYIIHLVSYIDALPMIAVLSDKRVIAFKNGSTHHFSITLLSDDQQREYVAEYEINPNKVPDPIKKMFGVRPELKSSVLRLKEFGAELVYDGEGNLTNQSLNNLRKGSKDFTFSIIPGKDSKTMKTGTGFILKSRTTGKEERYSFSGRRIVADTDAPPGPNGQREVIEKDVKQDITLNFSKYGDPNGISVSFYNIFKHHTEVLVYEEKTLKFFTMTRELCDNPERISFK